jgi:hypothetical protein
MAREPKQKNDKTVESGKIVEDEPSKLEEDYLAEAPDIGMGDEEVDGGS